MQKFVLIFLLYSTFLFANDEKPRIYLTWQHDPTTTMTIQWLSPKEKNNSELFYHVKTKKRIKEWAHSQAVTNDLPQKVGYVVNKIELTGLAPNTMYQFHFGNSKKQFRFRTMPKELSKPVRFVVGGDAFKSNIDRFQQMNKEAAKNNPRFAIIGGDIAYTAPKGKKTKKENFQRWLDFFAYWTEDMKDLRGCLIPLFVTIGNHEVKGGFHRTPKEAPFYYALFEKSMYDIQFGNYAHLIFLDSDHTSRVKGKQTKWLKKSLKASKEFTHRFVTYHVGAYPARGEFDDYISKSIRKHWCPLFDDYNVHACFECHNHVYKRSHLLRKGKVHPKGVLYIGDGSWGVQAREPEPAWYLAHTAAEQQVVVVEMSKEKRLFWAVNPKGELLDYCESAV